MADTEKETLKTAEEKVVEELADEYEKEWTHNPDVQRGLSSELRKMVDYDPIAGASELGRKIYAQSILHRAINYVNKLLKDYTIQREVYWDEEPLTIVIKVWYRKPKRKKEIQVP